MLDDASFRFDVYIVIDNDIAFDESFVIDDVLT